MSDTMGKGFVSDRQSEQDFVASARPSPSIRYMEDLTLDIVVASSELSRLITDIIDSTIDGVTTHVQF
jgi:hypothetical protein